MSLQINHTGTTNSVSVTDTQANVGVAVVPKGTGAFSLAVPDNTTVGGNARGTNAVDLQTIRTTAGQVASGARATVSGGNSNTASGSQATVCGGGSNTASGSNATVSGGNSNTASGSQATVSGGVSNIATATNTTVSGGNNNTAGGSQSTVSGGSSNTASGPQATVSGGQLNTASGTLSTIPGGQLATTNAIQGLLAYGFSGATLGQNQMSFFGARPVTTGTTPVRATADAGTASATNQLTLRDNSAFKVEGRVVARDTVTNDVKEWNFTTLIKRGANAAATSIVGTPSITSAFADTAAAAWTISVSADTTNGSLAINVTGAGANAINWTVVCWSQEVA